MLLALALAWRVASQQVARLLPVDASRLDFVTRVGAVVIVVFGLAGQASWETLRAWPAALLAVGSAGFWLLDAAMGGPPIALAGVSASVVLTAGLAGWRLGDEGVGALCAAATALVVCASAGVLQRLRRTRGLPLLELTLGAAVMGTVVTLLLSGDTPTSENTPVAYALGILGVAWLAASVATESAWPAIVGGVLASAAPIILDAAPPLLGEPTTAHLVAVLAIATAVWFAAARLHHNHNFGILGLVASYGLFAAALNTFAPNWETGWYAAAVIGFSLAWSQARGRGAEIASVDDDVVEWGSRIAVCLAILAAIGSEWVVQPGTDVLLALAAGSVFWVADVVRDPRRAFPYGAGVLTLTAAAGVAAVQIWPDDTAGFVAVLTAAICSAGGLAIVARRPADCGSVRVRVLGACAAGAAVLASMFIGTDGLLAMALATVALSWAMACYSSNLAGYAAVAAGFVVLATFAALEHFDVSGWFTLIAFTVLAFVQLVPARLQAPAGALLRRVSRVTGVSGLVTVLVPVVLAALTLSGMLLPSPAWLRIDGVMVTVALAVFGGWMLTAGRAPRWRSGVLRGLCRDRACRHVPAS